MCGCGRTWDIRRGFESEWRRCKFTQVEVLSISPSYTWNRTRNWLTAPTGLCPGASHRRYSNMVLPSHFHPRWYQIKHTRPLNLGYSSSRLPQHRMRYPVALSELEYRCQYWSLWRTCVAAAVLSWDVWLSVDLYGFCGEEPVGFFGCVLGVWEVWGLSSFECLESVMDWVGVALYWLIAEREFCW